MKLTGHKQWVLLCIFFSGIITLSPVVFSQKLNFKNFSSKNGLPSNEVYDVMQDKNGIMWFATDRGLCRYDGYEFVTFEPRHGIPGVAVQNFFPQENGDIWCTTIGNKLFWFNPKDYKIHAYKYNDLLYKSSEGRTSLHLVVEQDGSVKMSFKDRIGFVTISSTGELLIDLPFIRVANKHALTHFVFEGESDNGFGYLVTQEAYDRGLYPEHILLKNSKIGKVWGCSLDEIQLVSSDTRVQLYAQNELMTELKEEKEVIVLGRFDADHFFVGLRYGGVRIYDNSGKFLVSYLDSESVTNMTVDHEGGMWISTLSSGVFYLPTASVKCYELGATTSVLSLFFDDREGLIVNMKDGSNYQYDNERLSKKMASQYKYYSWSRYYRSIRANVQFIDTAFSVDGEVVLSGYYVKKLSDNVDENPIGLLSQGFFEYCHETGVEMHFFPGRTYEVFKNEGLYYVGQDNGLYEYKGKDKGLKRIFSEQISSRVSDIDLFGDRGLIVSTLGQGLALINNDEIEMIDMGDGIITNLVAELYIQNDSTVWVCTNQGLNRILFAANGDYVVSTMTQRDGLIDNDITDVEVVDDVVWVSTRTGLCSFPISEMDARKEVKLFLKILRTKANGTSMLDLTKLKYWQNRVEINFRAISFRERNGLNYRYKMVGLENKWTYTTNRDVVFESMPPGNYTFYVQAGVNGFWGDDIAKIQIAIAPPFYARLWFKFSVIFAIGLVAYLFFRFRILSYNRDIMRELLRQLLKLLSRKTYSFTVREKGKDVKINSQDVLYIKSSGNYLEIHTENGRHIIREKISNFLELVPDSIEYVQVRRSYIIRIDKVEAKGVNSVTIKGEEIRVGETYLKVLREIPL